MKNTIISAICVVLVFVYSIFTMMYVEDFSSKIKNELPVSLYNDDTDINISQIKDVYDSKKKILGVIINRDHAEELDDIIIKLETAVKFGDSQEIFSSAYNLKSALEHIEKLNNFTI
ncbi:MAG: DUF4363 family protein [Oscillospiraceae bacterium]|nr:DUF4363 family protein [Oscillospiraceae bacterium]